MKKLIIVYVVLIVAVILLAVTRAGGNLLSLLPLKQATAEIGESKINLIVAKSDEDRIKGLSGRQSLDKNQGMLFVFDKKDKYSFWMKGMNFPLDIIYIDNTRVVDLFENVPNKIDNAPNLTHYIPSTPANYVLEVNAGEAKRLNIKKGTELTLKGI
jgi:uncharacterized membrane protein (UPF0127 family)